MFGKGWKFMLISSPGCDFYLFEFMHIFFSGCSRLWVHMCIGTNVAGRYYFLGIIHHLWFWQTVVLFFHVHLWDLKRENLIKMSHLALNISTYLIVFKLWVVRLCVSCYHILQKEVSLTRLQRCTDLWVLLIIVLLLAE